jgi:hypothetical protein
MTNNIEKTTFTFSSLNIGGETGERILVDVVPAGASIEPQFTTYKPEPPKMAEFRWWYALRRLWRILRR